jgi:hypothetical protein
LLGPKHVKQVDHLAGAVLVKGLDFLEVAPAFPFDDRG